MGGGANATAELGHGAVREALEEPYSFFKTHRGCAVGGRKSHESLDIFPSVVSGMLLGRSRVRFWQVENHNHNDE